MALPVIAGIDRVSIRWSDTVTGQHYINVFHVREVVAAASSVVAANILGDFTAGMWSWMASSSSISQIQVLPLDGVSSSYVATVVPTANQTGGSGSATPLPAVAGIISLGTGLRGPANRGRLFLGPVAENEVTGQALGDVAAVQAQWTAFLAALLADDLALCVASYVHGNAHDVISARAESTVATQRRRVRRP